MTKRAFTTLFKAANKDWRMEGIVNLEMKWNNFLEEMHVHGQITPWQCNKWDLPDSLKPRKKL